jgi:hypothetical protein
MAIAVRLAIASAAYDASAFIHPQIAITAQED